MKVYIRNSRNSNKYIWLILVGMMACFGGMAVNAQDISKLEEINFTINRGGLLDPQIWRNPDTKLSKEAKIAIADANEKVEAAIMKGRPRTGKWSSDYVGGLASQLWVGRIRAAVYDYDEINTIAKKNVPGCHLSNEAVKEAMMRLDARLPWAPNFTVHCLPKCTGFGCGPQNTVTLRANKDPQMEGLFFKPRSDIWIRDTSPEALKGSYAATISDPFEQQVALVVHMIGRILHERNAGEFYYSLGGQPPATFSRALSPLAKTSKRMFVAEIVTALVMRSQVKDIDGQIVTNFTPEIMTEYTHLRGLRWWD